MRALLDAGSLELADRAEGVEQQYVAFVGPVDLPAELLEIHPGAGVAEEAVEELRWEQVARDAVDLEVADPRAVAGVDAVADERDVQPRLIVAKAAVAHRGDEVLRLGFCALADLKQPVDLPEDGLVVLDVLSGKACGDEAVLTVGDLPYLQQGAAVRVVAGLSEPLARLSRRLDLEAAVDARLAPPGSRPAKSRHVAPPTDLEPDRFHAARTGEDVDKLACCDTACLVANEGSAMGVGVRRSWFRGFGVGHLRAYAIDRCDAIFLRLSARGRLSADAVRLKSPCLREIRAMGDPGLEPGTSSLSEKRSNQLS